MSLASTILKSFKWNRFIRINTASTRLFSDNTIGVYLYVEFPIERQWTDVKWDETNAFMKQYDGLISKTWLSGVDSNFVGGFYEFDSRKNAENY
eukprot:99785_1